ncbi:virulence plasmid A protein [Pseudomonas sp. NFACC02]|uniref:Tc toxin subunit A n=1 Tax=Pseudomonas sp. NFACC02 TaxID=1566250 RepID=UPI0008D08704|nr:Tc toxin subunit A [Pseudomonas sp. NFACC02]SER47292.1 virulence plasmid A protein [Pseudomonas sp. NFACC02]
MADADKKSLISKLLSDPDAGGVKKTRRTPKSAKVSFAAAMGELGYTSVFDIVRESKSSFVSRLAERTDADGDLAYDNAQCYAAQIARSWREHQVSSGRKQFATARTGVRSLVDVGPSFPNLFKENWDQFCKVGAIAAVDSPVAYLNSLYSFIKREIEPGAGTGAILLDTRRPDLAGLVLDQQSTFTPRPMLDIVHQVLSSGIKDYLSAGDHPDKDKSIYEVLKDKRHPFIFPYDFHHQQIMLGLSGKKQPKLGELSYRASQLLPVYSDVVNVSYGATVLPAVPSSNAQTLLSGLSAEQQQIVVSESLFANFHLCLKDIKNDFRASTSHVLTPWQLTEPRTGFVLLSQSGITKINPSAAIISAGQSGYNHVTFAATADRAEFEVGACTYVKHNDTQWKTIPTARYGEECLSLCILESDKTLPESGSAYFQAIYEAEHSIDGVSGRTKVAALSFALSIRQDMTDDYPLTDLQRAYFLEHYGVDVPSCTANPLISAKTFMAQTGVTSEQLSALLSIYDHYPKFSPNVSRSPHWGDHFPYSMSYGACYVNGTGGWEVGALPAVRTQLSDASMGIEVDREATSGVVTSYLTNTSLNRFDRLQRMIRLQRWMNIPFAELDTLIMAVIHSEGESNLAWELNRNTLRALGVYRHLNHRYDIGPEEFAAFTHFLTAFASGDRTPLFDKVFNSPALFDTPLILDGEAFSAVEPDADSQKTIAQLCIGLGLAATDDEFGQMARDTALLLGPPDAEGKPVVVELKRTQAFVSSFYRQARIARLFGLSFRDSRALIDLLGGEAYLKRVVTGYVRSIGDETEQSDILDILMQLDWAVSWLNETGRDVSTLRVQLGLDPDPVSVTQALLDQVNQMRKELDDALLTREQMNALNLPDATKGSPAVAVDWWEGVLSTDDICDANGLLATVPDDSLSDPASYFATKLNGHMTGIRFSGDVDQQVVFERVQAQLLGFVTKGRIAQLRLFEGFFQSLSGLAMDRTEAVMRLAGTSGAAYMLRMLMDLTPDGASLSPPVTGTAKAFIERIQRVNRCAGVVQPLGLSASALLTFLTHPGWLVPSVLDLTLTLSTLYMLDRYSQWVKQAPFVEEKLLAYLRDANCWTGKDCFAQELALLIGWSAGEVLAVIGAFMDGVARTMADVDWVRRVKATCEQSRLSAAALMKATQLSPDSPPEDWQAVGEAAMAANR